MLIIIPLVAKVFEACLCVKLQDKFKFHDHQFGFVDEVGCEKATCAFHNTNIIYISERGKVMFTFVH